MKNTRRTHKEHTKNTWRAHKEHIKSTQKYTKSIRTMHKVTCTTTPMFMLVRRLPHVLYRAQTNFVRNADQDDNT